MSHPDDSCEAGYALRKAARRADLDYAPGINQESELCPKPAARNKCEDSDPH